MTHRRTLEELTDGLPRPERYADTPPRSLGDYSYKGVLATRNGEKTVLTPGLVSELSSYLRQAYWAKLSLTIINMVIAGEQQKTVSLEGKEFSITIHGASTILGGKWRFEGEISITSPGEK